MNKKIFGIIILTIIIVLGIIIGLNSTGLFSLSNSNNITIGYATPLTGDASSWGLQSKKGFDYGINQINLNGGINGKKINIIYEDDQCDPKTAVNIYNKMITIDNVKIITGTMCSNVAKAVIPITEKNKIFYLASGASEDSIPRMGKLISRLWASDSYEAKAIAEYALQNFSIKKIGIIYVKDYIASISLRDKFVETIKLNKNINIFEESILSNDKDYSTSILKILNNNPDAIYVPANPGQTIELVNKIRELGYKGIILPYGASLASKGIPEQITNKYNVYFAQPKDLRQTNFWNDYKHDMNEDADLLAALGYDSAMLLKSTLEKCDVNPECIKKIITETKNWQSARGNFSFDEYGDLKEIPYEIKQLE
jgi:branched-chain amino acid transport system substrate-binding protein